MKMIYLQIEDKRQRLGRNFNLKIKKNSFDLIRIPLINDERKPISAYSTSYGHHYNQNKTKDEIPPPSSYIPRAYSNLFNENKYDRLFSKTIYLINFFISLLVLFQVFNVIIQIL